MIILPILTISRIHFALKGLENVPFERGSNGVKERDMGSPFVRHLIVSIATVRAWEQAVASNHVAIDTVRVFVCCHGSRITS